MCKSYIFLKNRVMEEERIEGVYDIGYGYGNPCRYLQEVLNRFLRCLGLERSGGGSGGGGGEGRPGGGGEGGGDGGDGGEIDDPLTTPSSDDPLTMDPIDQPASATGLATRRPPRNPISSAGPGQTN